MPEKLLKIGDVAGATGLSIPTIRWYEEVGIVVPSRSQGGFRLYGPAQLERLLLVKPMKPLGLSLEEIREILGLLDDLRATPSDERATELYDRLRGHIASLTARRATLRKQLRAAEALTAQLERELAARVTETDSTAHATVAGRT